MITNRFENMWANVQNAKLDLKYTPMNAILDYMRSHEWVTTKELGLALYGKRYTDANRSFASQISAVLSKLVKYGYADRKEIEIEGKPFELEYTKEEWRNIYTDEEFFTYMLDGWKVRHLTLPITIDGIPIKGRAWKNVKYIKTIKPTANAYYLLARD